MQARQQCPARVVLRGSSAGILKAVLGRDAQGSRGAPDRRDSEWMNKGKIATSPRWRPRRLTRKNERHS
ncbi:hypothetical protein E2C01_058070 [Portunus trituberculatus]|uniref:Uncharacterized protein n=1 Tax=Portunus trituberculatus TaxID=210409 RepID=A0A5B7GYN3_PORTR|nr:hypothetical protein [Portunus trituberculatus]